MGNASNTQVALSNISALQGLTSLTIEAWILLAAIPTPSTANIFHFRNGNNGYLMYIDTSAKLNALVGNGASLVGNTSSSVVSTNAWHKVEVDWDGGTIYNFIDGTLHNTIALAGGNTGNPALAPCIGNQAAGARSFPGFISDVRISNVARHTSPYTPENGPLSPDGNTLALYHFFEGNGSVAYDSSTNANAATLSGTPSPTWCTGRWPGPVSARLGA
jgi:hypothetical protein